jgi:hypothetical protein
LISLLRVERKEAVRRVYGSFKDGTLGCDNVQGAEEEMRVGVKREERLSTR